jgi:DNA-binding response OmpR family regulator
MNGMLDTRSQGSSDSPAAEDLAAVGNIVVNSAAMTVTVAGHEIETSLTEFRLLEFLVRHPGRVFSREELLTMLGRNRRHVTPRAIDVYVRRLRAKIEPLPDRPAYLRTVRGAGYRMDAPEPESRGAFTQLS